MYLMKPKYELLTPIDRNYILKFLERCGRTCYKSEDRITDESAPRFVKMICQDKKHYSVIEHVSLTVKFYIDRGVSHELVRHRLAAYSQESTRYCNYGKKGITYIIPPWLQQHLTEREYAFTDSIFQSTLYLPLDGQEWCQSLLIAEASYNRLLGYGWQPQQARSVLPNALKTEIVATYDLNEWRHVFKMRTMEAAHPQMREVMVQLQAEFIAALPEVFQC